MINGKQSVQLKSDSIRFKNYFKQLAVSFKIYADFECLLKGVQSSDKNNGSNTEKYQDHIPCSFAYKVICIGNKFIQNVDLYRGRNAISRFIEEILEEYYYCQKLIKKHSNKNVVMSAKDQERFQLSSICWICNTSFDIGDDKVRDHCHITGNYRATAHWSCNIDFNLTKKVPVTFHNSRGYDSHLIIKNNWYI